MVVIRSWSGRALKRRNRREAPRKAPMPLVLVHNDVVANPEHQWDDVEGVHYHYPAKYRRKVQTAEPFVYYRGVHRVGGKRGPAEYVGSGRIGKIWPDPERKNAWYCAVVNYARFPTPVPAKVDGQNREDIPPNLWRDGVRVLDPQVYAQIMAEGGGMVPIAGSTPKADQANVTAADDLVLPAELAKHQTPKSGHGPNRRAKAIGDWAEQAALKYIKEQVVGCSDCVHRAGIGETPGWDIDYRDAKGALQRVEVKGTIAAAFAGIELTANEMRAAKAHGPDYWLCLVAGCESEQARVQFIQNPAAKLAAGEWRARPALFAVSFATASDRRGVVR